MPHENDEGSQNPSDTQKAEAQPDQAAVGNMINSAVTSQLKRFAEKQLPGLFAEAMKPFAEQLAKMQAAPPPPAQNEEDKKKVSPEVAALTQQLEELKSKLKSEAEQRAAAERKAREDRAFSDFKSHLAKSVRPDVLDVIANHLFHIKKQVEVGEDGTVTFKGVRTNFGIQEEVAYPLKEGVENWLKGEDAKPYLPSPGTSNTPQTRKTTVLPSTLPKDLDLNSASPAQRLQKAEELEQQYAQLLAARGMKL